ncbi:FliM/FliN family flagellar motor switch protein [Trinickia terrae]|uniref:FliM/FliN family flagellar motor switch protein n=1 Tax=Trinickia terrae TaxID=2571161 RepID=A0A4U1I7Q3_9BURK|nr:FliM/FliN family flagellar motor C-terminal domain-containing protein [Trinickia terrae]TKC89453.1 FliM/FliN family flagellar motor switch protein [Trinickia terrae]
MSAVEAIRWRPPGADELADLSDARALVEAAIAPWLGEWLDGAALKLEAVEPIARQSEYAFPAGAQVWSSGPHLWWAAPPRALARLVNRALDLYDSFMMTGPAKRPEALMLFEQKLTGALFDALSAASGEPADGPQRETSRAGAANTARAPLRLPYGGAQLRLRDERSGETLLTVVCATPLLWERRAQTAKQTGAPLAARAAAIDAVKVSVSARLAQAELSVAQLLGLAPGDVIAIERSLDAPISLVVDAPDGGRPAAVGTGRIGRTGEQFSIQLTSISQRNP